MKAITYTEAKERLSDTIARVCADHEPVVIMKPRNRKRGEESVVMVSREDYESLLETSYLLRSPKNARRLLQSIQQLEEGRGQERQLLE